ncbi:hypothetical protein CGRA01v4_13015 [Colletotrichum graminicola]|uniref:Transmembrane protein n=1 Tax=Colletotrichum graminicola (strain M1.001 / M2 / FGSC 10212) TaxID=645133 RepID=E3QLW6_COLGM|nr:uncharacterized protein GLRG_06998 [Colletotrichum graminicola M1.001]EFQ31854.1 hypothetical protein GLRG_06998 [Colletotrichum graminicola M1.001]WDK21725.1 hypothetical protein CGRA01v4_13015 [Colletotrichum graminicola]
MPRRRRRRSRRRVVVVVVVVLWCFGYWVLAVFVRLIPVDSSVALGSLYSAQATLRGRSRAQAGENGPMRGGGWLGSFDKSEREREWRGEEEKNK